MDLNNFARSHPEVAKAQPGTLTLNFQNMPLIMKYSQPVYYQIPVKKTIFKCPNYVENFLRFVFNCQIVIPNSVLIKIDPFPNFRTAEKFTEESIPHTYNLACENGHSVSVHRVVLASSSPYLYRVRTMVKTISVSLSIVIHSH